MGPMKDVPAKSRLMSAVPGFGGWLKWGQDFRLIGSSRPRIEEITAPTLGRNLHLGGTLSPGITIEAGVPHDRVQHRTGEQLITIRYAYGLSAPMVICGRALRNERIYVCEFDSRRKNIE